MASQIILTTKGTALTRRTGRENAFSRQVERVAGQVEDARAQMHRAQAAVHVAETDLLARRLECEAAVIQLADLADLLESLQSSTARECAARS